VQDCCSNFVVITSFDHRSFLYCANSGVFYPCLDTCNSTSFICCVCLKSCKDKGCSVLRSLVFQRGGVNLVGCKVTSLRVL